MKNPCDRCKDRVQGCHAACEPYLAFAKWMREHHERIRLERFMGYITWSRKGGFNRD